MKTIIKKKSKSIKIIGKSKVSKVKLDSVQALLTRSGCKEAIQPRSRSYVSVAYFLKHKPVVNKAYKASEVLKENESSLPFIGSTTRANLLKVFKSFKKIIGIEKKEGNANLFTSFKFSK